MLADKIKESPQGSFKVTQLCQSLAICEALKDAAAALASRDRFNWSNATETHPAFLVYLGCRQDEVAGYIKTFNIFYRCYWCEIRQPKYLKEFEAEIKILGMQRASDSYAFGLDDLLQSEEAKHFGSNYTTGVMQR